MSINYKKLHIGDSIKLELDHNIYFSGIVYYSGLMSISNVLYNFYKNQNSEISPISDSFIENALVIINQEELLVLKIIEPDFIRLYKTNLNNDNSNVNTIHSGYYKPTNVYKNYTLLNEFNMFSN